MLMRSCRAICTAYGLPGEWCSSAHGSLLSSAPAAGGLLAPKPAGSKRAWWSMRPELGPIRSVNWQAHVGLVPKRRTAFTFPAPPGADPGSWPVVCDIDEDFYFKPESTQLMGSLAEETPMEPHDVRPEEIDVALAIERIEAATTLQIRSVSSTWAGLRSFVADRRPVAGMDPDLDGFFWLAGQGGFGIMTSPALSRAVEGLIVDGRLPAELDDLGVVAAELGPARLR